MEEAHGGANRPAVDHIEALRPHPAIAPPLTCKERLEIMVNNFKKTFGKRLFALMEACELNKKDIARYVGLSTTIQVDNYLKGEQGPTFEGFAKLRILFGVKSGEVDGSEPWPTALDPAAVRERLNKLD